MTFHAALNKKFADLPMVRIRPTLSDDDIEFQSDMRYFHDLLNSIVSQAASGGHCGPWPGDLSNHFDWLTNEVNRARAY